MSRGQRAKLEDRPSWIVTITSSTLATSEIAADGTSAVVREPLELYERKGNIAAAAVARRSFIE